MASSTSTPAPSRSLSSKDRQRRCLTCLQARAQQQLTITTSGAKPAIKPIRQPVNGQVVGAEVADLNSNGTPEIYVFVEGAGSGSYGELVANARSATSSRPVKRAGCCGPPMLSSSELLRQWPSAGGYVAAARLTQRPQAWDPFRPKINPGSPDRPPTTIPP